MNVWWHTLPGETRTSITQVCSSLLGLLGFLIIFGLAGLV